MKNLHHMTIRSLIKRNGYKVGSWKSGRICKKLVGGNISISQLSKTTVRIDFIFADSLAGSVKK